MSAMTTGVPLLPGATLGMLGGGQLGRMFTTEALRMGYKVWVLDPDPQSPAGKIATRHFQAAFDDTEALNELATCAAISIEFENIPVSSLEFLAARTRVAPSANAVLIAQDRIAEKNFAQKNGIEIAAFGAIENASDIPSACENTGFPAILKTARLGYDGKGQVVCQNIADVEAGFNALAGVCCVLEKKIDLACEVSVVLARDDAGQVSCFPVAENQHENGILELSIVPARVELSQADSAIEKATALAGALNYVGVMAVEFFVTQAGTVLMNEMAPRPHNSGHFTLDATATSQFDQQVRMLCGLPAGNCALLSPVVMLNLLGERWLSDRPNWIATYETAHAHLHLYAKESARAGRKMGHVNVFGESVADALTIAEHLRVSI